ncbi:hypothetical protein AA0472_1964 [Acetobacter estunensis NRIC 0472]|nr:hypothetical protein AA0472_1964 [Acetobacter estunensis NRIC 0472]
MVMPPFARSRATPAGAAAPAGTARPPTPRLSMSRGGKGGGAGQSAQKGGKDEKGAKMSVHVCLPRIRSKDRVLFMAT